MPRNGSGTFTRTNGYNTGANMWATDRDGGVKIVAVRHDTHDQDIAAAITASIANDGQTPIVADLPMAGYRHTNVGDATGRTQYASCKQVQDSSVQWGGTTGGSSSAYTATLSPAITSYANGLTVRVKIHTNCAANATLNVNGVGQKTIYFNLATSTALRANELLDGEVVTFVYHSTGSGAWVLQKTRLLKVLGTTNQVTVTEGANDYTISFPSAVVMPNTAANQIMITNASGQVASVDYLTFTSTHLDPKTDNNFILGSASKIYQTLYTYGIIGGNATFKILTPSGYGQYLMTNGDAINPKVVIYPTGGMDINANSSSSAVLKLGATGIIDFRGTMGNSTKAPQTVAPDDWVEVKISGATYYLPAYAAS